MKEVHIERFNKLVDYINNNEEYTIVLKRMEIADVVGVSEGDSLKKIFKILNEEKPFYNKHFFYKKENKKHIFEKLSLEKIEQEMREEEEKQRKIQEEEEIKLKEKNKKELEINLLILKLQSEIKRCLGMLETIKKKSKDDYNFCKKEFKEDIEFMKVYSKPICELDIIEDRNSVVDFLKNKIDNVYMTYNCLKLFYYIS